MDHDDFQDIEFNGTNKSKDELTLGSNGAVLWNKIFQFLLVFQLYKTIIAIH